MSCIMRESDVALVMVQEITIAGHKAFFGSMAKSRHNYRLCGQVIFNGSVLTTRLGAQRRLLFQGSRSPNRGTS